MTYPSPGHDESAREALATALRAAVDAEDVWDDGTPNAEHVLDLLQDDGWSLRRETGVPTDIAVAQDAEASVAAMFTLTLRADNAGQKLAARMHFSPDFEKHAAASLAHELRKVAATLTTEGMGRDFVALEFQARREAQDRLRFGFPTIGPLDADGFALDAGQEALDAISESTIVDHLRGFPVAPAVRVVAIDAAPGPTFERVAQILRSAQTEDGHPLAGAGASLDPGLALGQYRLNFAPEKRLCAICGGAGHRQRDFGHGVAATVPCTTCRKTGLVDA